MANEIDPPWLLDRAGLPAVVGAQWLDVMARCGWITGGDASFGRWLRRPVKLTDAGREQLEAERDRLRARSPASERPHGWCEVACIGGPRFQVCPPSGLAFRG